jgi:hypothetical protein
MKQPTQLMLHTLEEIGDSTTTGFGYNYNPNGKRNLNINTVHACIKRGLLEPAGEELWNGQKTPVYRVSEAGKEALPPVLPKDDSWKQVFLKTTDEPKTYPDLASAQEAMDRGETVRIEMEPFTIDPALVQLAIDLQYKERFEQWKAQENAK